MVKEYGMTDLPLEVVRTRDITGFITYTRDINGFITYTRDITGYVIYTALLLHRFIIYLNLKHF